VLLLLSKIILGLVVSLFILLFIMAFSITIIEKIIGGFK